ncbi:hypothetical protein BVY00_01575 [bacterium G20]|nr:hypothetical protein BVY00_01575 [bacterium G20]
MILLHSQPTLTDLEALAAKVPTFPFSVKQLINLAREEHFPEEVINFYKAFPKDEVFEDIEDLIARTEQVEIMQHDETGQPENFLDAFDED